MTLYLDTSVIIAALFEEQRSALVRDWLSQQDAILLRIGDWAMPEVSSVMAIKLRTWQICLEQRASALSAFATPVFDSLTVLPVTGAPFRMATRFMDQHAPGLRLGDALYLAIAKEHGAMVVTLDRKLADVGVSIGVRMTFLS